MELLISGLNTFLRPLGQDLDQTATQWTQAGPKVWRSKDQRMLLLLSYPKTLTITRIQMKQWSGCLVHQSIPLQHPTPTHNPIWIMWPTIQVLKGLLKKILNPQLTVRMLLRPNEFKAWDILKCKWNDIITIGLLKDLLEQPVVFKIASAHFIKVQSWIKS